MKLKSFSIAKDFNVGTGLEGYYLIINAKSKYYRYSVNSLYPVAKLFRVEIPAPYITSTSNAVKYWDEDKTTVITDIFCLPKKIRTK